MAAKPQASSIPKRCFLISPIGEPESPVRRRADKILKHIVRPVCAELGFEVVRADEMNHTSLISRRVMEEILTSDLVIADLTGSNPNVYYELAVRHYTGKPVVQILESSEQLPFDVSDLNTIRLDHTDLDSVHEAKERLAQFILSTDDASKCYNPVSAALESLDIRLNDRREGTMTLAETFQGMATQIIAELQASKRERELLWKKLFDAPPQAQGPQSAVDIDLSGAWDTNIGAAKLIQDGDIITGKYQYKGQGWVGELNGQLIGRRVVFEFQWTTRPISGVGFFDYTHGQLEGFWYYIEEAEYRLKELLKNPGLFERNPIKTRTRENRHWVLKRASPLYRAGQ
jgi:nucleoside 2-deoxyribosyltransferase